MLYLWAEDRYKRNKECFTTIGAIRAGIIGSKESVAVKTAGGKHDTAKVNYIFKGPAKRRRARKKFKRQRCERSHRNLDLVVTSPNSQARFVQAQVLSSFFLHRLFVVIHPALHGLTRSLAFSPAGNSIASPLCGGRVKNFLRGLMRSRSCNGQVLWIRKMCTTPALQNLPHRLLRMGIRFSEEGTSKAK